MNLTTYRNAINDVPFVRGLPKNMRDRVAMMLFWVAEVRDIAEGAPIYVEGRHEDETGCILVRGKVLVSRSGGVEEELDAPNLLGEIQQFTPDRHRTATVVALQPAHVLDFSWQAFAERAARLLDTEEQHILRSLIAQLAWARCDELFDRAAKAAQDANA